MFSSVAAPRPARITGAAACGSSFPATWRATTNGTSPAADIRAAVKAGPDGLGGRGRRQTGGQRPAVGQVSTADRRGDPERLMDRDGEHPEQPGQGGERVLRAQAVRGEQADRDRNRQRGQHQQRQPAAAGHGLGEQHDADQQDRLRRDV